MDPKNPFSKAFKASPLTLDRILEGKPIAAQDCPLFRLPLEILSEIIKYIESDRETLATLALVNSDCRQLARSCQFANVVLDDSERSKHLFDVLIREAAERSMSITEGGLTRQPSLGACIRYITSSNQHRDDKTDVTDGLRAISIGENKGNNEDNKSIDDPSLGLVFTSLPHLEMINWTTQVAVEHHVFTSLRASTVRHLKLHGHIDPEILAFELEGKTLWPLLSLDINIRKAPYIPDKEVGWFEASPFFSSLFQACSSTLQFLKFSYQVRFSQLYITATFPHLRSLVLRQHGQIVHGSTLRSFLQSQQLSTFFIDFGQSWTRECLNEIGYYPKLHTLIWTSGYMIRSTAELQWLEKNNHLKEFGIETRQFSSFLERVIPILASFSNLKVLSLIWEGTTIPDSSLTGLALLTSLEKLHISSGYQQYSHNWFIDHDAIQSTLSPLRKLKRILFTRDGYRSELRESGNTYYYSFRQPDTADLSILTEIAAREGQREGDDLYETAWEWRHRERMTRHAENYAATFPSLEWIHLGQLSFTFETGVDGKRTTVLVDRERKEHFPVLETMFGISDD